MRGSLGVLVDAGIYILGLPARPPHLVACGHRELDQLPFPTQRSPSQWMAPRLQLDNPNLNDPAQREAYALLKENPANYKKKVKELAQAYARDMAARK